MRNLIIILIAVFMLVGTTAKAEWTDRPDLFGDIITSENQREVVMYGVTYTCVERFTFVWGSKELAGKTETCFAASVVPSEDPQDEEAGTCNGCPIITHEITPVKSYRFKQIR